MSENYIDDDTNIFEDSNSAGFYQHNVARYADKITKIEFSNKGHESGMKNTKKPEVVKKEPIIQVKNLDDLIRTLANKPKLTDPCKIGLLHDDIS